MNSTIRKPISQKIVSKICESVTIANGNLATFNVTYYEEGYNCYPLHVTEYRTTPGWYIHFKSVDVNQVVFDYINSTGSQINATPYVYWLCISK